ncbi:hypothetical protein ACFPT7_06830 [Acidicapsa dinghuensis]|uniref:Uncharacterized protein n=1 Tax=Acidicapsa dinghuensis TaxID=2218256 RepID=A0ABW1ECG7_9BACT|nr:hypothetical protein [Acidicapsa dinghuensis]
MKSLIVVVLALASLTLPLTSQTRRERSSNASRKTSRWTQIPFTTEFRITTVQTSRDGTIVTQEMDEVNAFDSQWRHLLRTTSLANGFSSSVADDPVKGTRTVWNTSSPQTKLLLFPTPVEGRESCWEIAPDDQRLTRGEAQFGMISAHCMPEGQHQFPYCHEDGEAVPPPDGDLPVPEPSYEDCLKHVHSENMPTQKISEKDDDLGDETINHVVAHGCRVTVTATDGTYHSELWLAKIGTVKHNTQFALRRITERPSSSLGIISTKYELIDLNLSEPDISVFAPPENYSVKTVSMHEVSCNPARDPAQGAASAH